MTERTVLYLDLPAGVAGDMLVGALLDLGAHLPYLRDGLERLGFGPIGVEVETVRRGPFRALRFVVEETPAVPMDRYEAHDHDHDHDHDHPHDHPAGSGELGDPPVRSWREIRERLEAADLPPRVRARSLLTFRHLAEAEARVHGVEVERVHFHEVGAVDSIADVVGCALALEDLGVDRVVAGPPPLGEGSIRTAHGLLPLPAPATLELMRGWPVRPAPGPGEWTTPTGAALLTALAVPGSLPSMVLLGTGHGAGTRDRGPVPNVVRAVLGREIEAAPAVEDLVVLEAQVDDLPGEWVPPLLEALLAAGAFDAFATPVLMKKGRPGLLVTAPVASALADRVAREMLVHGGTLGVRGTTARRWCLPRTQVTVETPWGSVRIKVATLPDGSQRGAPEHEDCARLARVAAVPVGEVWQSALGAWRAHRS